MKNRSKIETIKCVSMADSLVCTIELSPSTDHHRFTRDLSVHLHYINIYVEECIKELSPFFLNSITPYLIDNPKGSGVFDKKY